MAIITFLVVIVVLILVHEFGHFAAAKFFKMRVDEFGIGYPPKVFGIKKGETEYTINALPFGGFVRIFGEDNEAAKEAGSFAGKSHFAQLVVLFAGVFMNVVLAFVIFSVIFMMPYPRALSDSEIANAKDVSLVVVSTLPDSPAAQAGLMSGDKILSVTKDGETTDTVLPSQFISFVSDSADTLHMSINRDGEVLQKDVTPKAGVVAGSEYGIGIALSTIGVLPMNALAAIQSAFSTTVNMLSAITLGFFSIIAGLFTFSANISSIAGPIGIAGIVGKASAEGMAALLSLTAIISLNLAVLNLLPFPALDGGRILFVLIEGISGKRIPAKFANSINAIGFILLIALMIIVSIHDVGRLLG